MAQKAKTLYRVHYKGKNTFFTDIAEAVDFMNTMVYKAMLNGMFAETDSIKVHVTFEAMASEDKAIDQTVCGEISCEGGDETC